MKLKIRGLVFAGFAAAVFAQSALAVETDDKTVTSKTYVDSKIQGTVNNATTINASSPDTKAPSELNVYKFVENRIISSGGGIDGNIDYHTDKIGYLDSTWAATANTGLSAPYMVTKAQLDAHPTWADHVVKWELIVPDSVVAETATKIGAAGASGATEAVQEKFPTAKAVYDFVVNGDPNDPDNNGFQPAVNTLDTNVVKVGWYNTIDSKADWGTLRATPNGNDATDPSLGYLDISQQVSGGSGVPGSSSYNIGIKGTAIANEGSAVYAVGGTGGTAHLVADKLTTAKAVYDYAVKQNWGQQHEGKHLVINSSGMVDLSDTANPDIPVPTNTNCAQAGGTAVCALVAYWDATLNNNAGGVHYEWTVMAGTGS